MKFKMLLLGPFLLIFLSSNASSELSIKTWETDRGSPVYFVSAPEIPMVDVRLIFAGGSVRDEDKAGTAKIVNRLLLEGAGTLRALQFKDKLAATGARLFVDSLREMAYISLRTLKDEEYFKEAVSLLTLAVSKPRFDGQELKRAIEKSLLSLRLEEQSLGALADENLWSGIYGDHPYGSPPLGTYESLSKITRRDLSEFHRTYYVNKNMVIAIVGALQEPEARKLSESISTELPIGKNAPPIPEIRSASVVEKIISKDSEQTHIRLGQPGMVRGDQDYFPLLVGNHVLGGNGLVSLLFKEIRSKRGLSYSSYSYFVPMEKAGPFVLGMQTENSKKDEALKVLRKTLKDFINDGPSEEDLELAKDNLINGFPNRIDSNQKILGYLGMMGFYGLPLDYLDTFPDKIENVGMDEVKSAFRRRISPDLTTVIVGKESSDTE